MIKDLKNKGLKNTKFTMEKMFYGVIFQCLPFFIFCISQSFNI